MKFQDLIGQEAPIRKLQDAVQQNRLPHALLLTGPAGVGELPLALALAQYVNCLNPQAGDSCGSCSNCIKINKAIHPDLKFILPIISKKVSGKQVLSDEHMDLFREQFLQNPYLTPSSWQQALGGESKQLMISVHEIREMKRSIFLKAFEARYKVIIVWQADRINKQGANAFLKLLEEPPDQTLFILTTSRPDHLINTILSRCQRLPLQRIPKEKIQQFLEKQKGRDSGIAEEAASLAEGSIGNAQELLEERTQSLSQTYIHWLRAVYAGNYAKIQEQLAPIFSGSREWQKLFLLIALKKIRDSLHYHLELQELALTPSNEHTFQEKFSTFATPERVDQIVRILEEGLRHISGNAHAQMTFSAISIKIHQILRAP